MNKENNKKNGVNEILQYIETHGITDKDVRSSLKSQRKKRPYQKHKKGIRYILDLHGKTTNEAIPLLRNTFHTCKKKGIGHILIIHGKGNNSDPQLGPVMKNLVLEMLETEFIKSIYDFHPALPRDGGDGATIVKLL